MAVVDLNPYGPDTAITMDCANLASSATFEAGRSGVQIDNTTDLYLDAHVHGRLSVGTTPTADTQIRIYCWGALVSLATRAIDTIVGTDAAITLTNGGVLKSALSLADSITNEDVTSDVEYPVRIISVCRALGLKHLPPFWGLYIAHNTGVALRNTAVNTNSFFWRGVKGRVT